MVKLRKITLSGFRGARYPFSVDLGKSCRSIAIFGENGAGKSTITDAVEWWFKNRIEHLWREDCKEKSLRNFLIKDTDQALVRLDFSDEAFSCEKRIASDLGISETNTDVKFKAFKLKAADERVVLRTSDLIDFLGKSKGDKRKDIGEIIGFESLAEFRDLIQKGENDLRKDGEYTHAVRSQDEAKSKLMTISGSMPVREQDLFQKASELVSSLKLTAKISDVGSYQGALDELTRNITNKESATKQLKLKQLSKTCESLMKALAAARSISKRFVEPYNTLVADKEKIKFLNVEKFLTQGSGLLDEGLFEPGKCPFCESTVDLEHVRKEVAIRIAQLEALRKSFDSTLILRDQWVADLKEVSRLVAELEERCPEPAIDFEFPDRVNAVKKDVAGLVFLIPEKSRGYQEIVIDECVNRNARALEDKLRARMDSASAEVAMLELTAEEQSALSMIQTLKELRAAFDSYQINAKIKDSFERQIKTLAKIKESFIKLQFKSLQEVLDVMSDDIERYYLALHPKENIDGVKLRMVGAEGVEFEYSFHGKETYPPKKYLSESHLNSLGIALFLSSAKLFNKECH